MSTRIPGLVRRSAAAVAVCAATAFGGTIDLTSGTTGAFHPGQSYNETRAAQVTSKMRAVLSLDAVSTDRPSGLNVADQTPPLGT